MSEKIKVNGLVAFGDMIFREIEGGFGANKKAMSVKDIAAIHGKELKYINKQINVNIKRFEYGVDIIDLKLGSFDEPTFETLGYNKQAVANSENIYILSERGYAKLLKLLEDDLAWDKFDELLDGYFHMRKEIRDSYKAAFAGMTEYQRMMVQTRRENIRIRKARELERLSKKYEGKTFAQVLDSYATKELTGEHLIPLPATQKTYSAGQIGEMFGITATAVGIIANKSGLKIDKQTGEYRNDKSRSSNKEVSNFYYYECVLPEFEHLAAQWKANHEKKPSKKIKNGNKAA